MKGFDPLKASFYLIAGVIALHGLIIVLGYILCAIHFEHVISGHYECDKGGRLSEMLAAAMAAAMAFVGGFLWRGKKDDKPE